VILADDWKKLRSGAELGDPSRRAVWFFETRDRALEERGVIVRAQREEGGGYYGEAARTESSRARRRVSGLMRDDTMTTWCPSDPQDPGGRSGSQARIWEEDAFDGTVTSG
jgi:hypothetical protein